MDPRQIWLSPTLGCTDQSTGVVTIRGIYCVIGIFLQFIPPLLILAAVAMLILGGAKLIMAGDDPKGYKTAMQTITMAIIGIVGLGLSWIILRVIGFVTGADTTNFIL